MMQEINARCRLIREDDLELLMNWRMLPEITKYMNTDPVLTLDGQKKWFERIQKSEDSFYWMIEVDGVPAGLVSLVNLDNVNKRISSGVYIANKEKRSLFLIMSLQWNLYDYAFDKLGLNKVCEEVFSENKAVLRILDMCGSKKEGELKSHIHKNNNYYDVTVRGILKDDWSELKKKYSYSKFEFEEKNI